MSSYEEEAAKYAEKGEQWVREMLATNRFNEERRATARTWLDLQEAARRSSTEAEQMAIARSAAADASRAATAAERAADAADRQARSAKWANRIAALALAISVIAIIVSIMRQ